MRVHLDFPAMAPAPVVAKSITVGLMIVACTVGVLTVNESAHAARWDREYNGESARVTPRSQPQAKRNVPENPQDDDEPLIESEDASSDEPEPSATNQRNRFEGLPDTLRTTVSACPAPSDVEFDSDRFNQGSLVYVAPNQSPWVLRWGPGRGWNRGSECSSVTYPIKSTSILWAGLVNNDTARRLNSGVSLMIDQTAGGQWTGVSEIEPYGANARPSGSNGLVWGNRKWTERPLSQRSVDDMTDNPYTFLPLGQSFLPNMTWRSFGEGAETRVTVVASGQNKNNRTVTLQCSAGHDLVGVVFKQNTPGFLPATDDRTIAIKAYGSGTFELAMAETPRALEDFPRKFGFLPAEAESRWYRYDFPEKIGRNSPIDSWIVYCPPDEDAEVTLEGWNVEGDNQSDRLKPTPKATWIWNEGAWMEDPTGLVNLLKSAGLTRAYIAIPLTKNQQTGSPQVSEPAALKTFIQAATDKNIDIWVVDGDPHDVLTEERNNVVARALAYQRYNGSVDRPAKLAGVQFDIEPYLLPGYSLGPDRWNQAYVDTVAAIHKSLSLPLDMVIPFWFNTLSLPSGQPLMDGLAPHVNSVTIMDYRTDVAQIQANALPYMIWGSMYDRPVQLALEGTYLPDSTMGFFTPANTKTAGNVWLSPLDDTWSFLLLLKEKGINPEGKTMTQHHVVPISGKNTTYYGRVDSMLDAVIPIEKGLHFWSAYNGISFHNWRALQSAKTLFD